MGSGGKNLNGVDAKKGSESMERKGFKFIKGLMPKARYDYDYDYDYD